MNDWSLAAFACFGGCIWLIFFAIAIQAGVFWALLWLCFSVCLVAIYNRAADGRKR